MATTPVMETAPPTGVGPDQDPTGGIPWQAWLAIGLAGLSGIETVLRGMRAALAAIAPHTKTTIDDRARDLVGKLDDDALALLRTLLGMVPASSTATSSRTTSEPLDEAKAAEVLPSISGPTDLPCIFVIPGSGALLALILAAGITLQPACATIKAVPPVAGHAIVDCAKVDALPILTLVAQLGIQAALQVLDLGKIAWPDIEATAWAEGKVVGGCAADRFVAAMSKAPVTPGLLATGPAPGEAMLARLSARWGGVEWRSGAEVR